MNEMIKLANELKYEATWKRFNYTAAATSQKINDRYYLIKSYATIVGIADAQEKKIYEFGKYSQTTSKQFTQICNQIFNGYERMFIKETNWR